MVFVTEKGSIQSLGGSWRAPDLGRPMTATKYQLLEILASFLPGWLVGCDEL